MPIFCTIQVLEVEKLMRISCFFFTRALIALYLVLCCSRYSLDGQPFILIILISFNCTASHIVNPHLTQNNEEYSTAMKRWNILRMRVLIILSQFQKYLLYPPTMQLQKITFEIKTQNDQSKSFSFDPKILSYNIQYVANNHHEPYPIPKNVATSLRPFQIMNDFVLAHNYSTQSFKVVKPLNSSNFAELVDPITFKIFSKYCDEKYADEATEVIKLAEYIRFHELSDAVSAAVATNFYIGEVQKSLDEFIKRNGLEDIGSQQICDIIKLYEDQFRMIEHKYKEEMLKVSETDIIQES